MKIILSTLLISLISLSNALADDFKVKIQVTLVNHESPKGVEVKVLERGSEIMSEKLGKDGETKLTLSEGKLYEIVIEKEGYLSHVIHNVHDEGSGKYKITLYRPTKKVKTEGLNYAGINRTFESVKKMTIPAEYLSQGVAVTLKEDINSEEKVNLKAIQKIAKRQEKAQKKIDKYNKKLEKLKKDLSDVNAEYKAGKLSDLEIEEERLKIQKKIVEIEATLEKLDY